MGSPSRPRMRIRSSWNASMALRVARSAEPICAKRACTRAKALATSKRTGVEHGAIARSSAIPSLRSGRRDHGTIAQAHVLQRPIGDHIDVTRAARNRSNRAAASKSWRLLPPPKPPQLKPTIICGENGSNRAAS